MFVNRATIQINTSTQTWLTFFSLFRETADATEEAREVKVVGSVGVAIFATATGLINMMLDTIFVVGAAGIRRVKPNHETRRLQRNQYP